MSSVTYLSTQLDKMLRFMRNPKKKSNSIPCIRALQVQQQVTHVIYTCYLYPPKEFSTILKRAVAEKYLAKIHFRFFFEKGKYEIQWLWPNF